MRTLAPELLDHLPVNDPRAQQSRRDLRRINAWMRNAEIIAGALAGMEPAPLVEIGSGDGTLLLAVARRLHPTAVTLIDRQRVVADETLRQFACPARAVVTDVFAALEETRDAIVIANMFLHHFSDDNLRQLFVAVAGRCRALVACEPRRSAIARAVVQLLPVIGCNAVTRHDARVSIRAGFFGRELSELWPAGWELQERRAGLCSHLFVARRR